MPLVHVLHDPGVVGRDQRRILTERREDRIAQWPGHAGEDVWLGAHAVGRRAERHIDHHPGLRPGDGVGEDRGRAADEEVAAAGVGKRGGSPSTSTPIIIESRTCFGMPSTAERRDAHYGDQHSGAHSARTPIARAG